MKRETTFIELILAIIAIAAGAYAALAMYAKTHGL